MLIDSTPGKVTSSSPSSDGFHSILSGFEKKNAKPKHEIYLKDAEKNFRDEMVEPVDVLFRFLFSIKFLLFFLFWLFLQEIPVYLSVFFFFFFLLRN